MSYHVYYETKHLSSGKFVVYCTEYTDDEPVTKVLFENLTENEARKLCAALRKAFSNGKKKYKTDLIKRITPRNES